MSAKALAVLKQLLPMVEEQVESVGYGFFCGGDPHKFTPDPESSTPEEQAKWRADCEAWARGEQVDTSGNVGRRVDNMHVQPGGYGLGSYTYKDPQYAQLVDDIKAAIAELS